MAIYAKSENIERHSAPVLFFIEVMVHSVCIRVFLRNVNHDIYHVFLFIFRNVPNWYYQLAIETYPRRSDKLYLKRLTVEFGI